MATPHGAFKSFANCPSIDPARSTGLYKDANDRIIANAKTGQARPYRFYGLSAAPYNDSEVELDLLLVPSDPTLSGPAAQASLVSVVHAWETALSGAYAATINGVAVPACSGWYGYLTMYDDETATTASKVLAECHGFPSGFSKDGGTTYAYRVTLTFTLYGEWATA